VIRSDSIMDVKCENLPYNPKGVSVNVVALDNVFAVLKHDLNEGSKISTHDWGVKVHGFMRRGIWNASNLENPTNLEVISELQRGISWYEWYTVQCISLLPIHLCCWALQYNCPANVNQTIMVGALRIWPWSTCCQVCPINCKAKEIKVDHQFHKKKKIYSPISCDTKKQSEKICDNWINYLIERACWMDQLIWSVGPPGIWPETDCWELL